MALQELPSKSFGSLVVESKQLLFQLSAYLPTSKEETSGEPQVSPIRQSYSLGRAYSW
jgi:hypothetical protein